MHARCYLDRMRRGLIAVVAWIALAGPSTAAAAFNCAKSVQAHSSWCASSQITSIPAKEATAACTDSTKRLAEQCRADWDRFASCGQFAGRFSKILVKACEARGLPHKACQDWGEAYQVGPLARCERGKTGY